MEWGLLHAMPIGYACLLYIEGPFWQLAELGVRTDEGAITEGAEAMLGDAKLEEGRWLIYSWVQSY